MIVIYKEGSRDVAMNKAIQRKVGAPADGKFGPQTTRFVKSWQVAKGLTPDGLIGPKTLKLMGLTSAVDDLSVKVYTSKQLMKQVKFLDDFEALPKGYWIIGVRNPHDSPDKFDDMFYLMKGEEIVHKTTGTTNPGVKILKGGFRKYNNDGAAVVEADRIYYDVWKYGKHLGWMPALKQLGASITVWRDGDMDGKSEQIGKRTTGWYGINFHTATKSYLGRIIKATIGGWSAGCQVCNNTVEYMEIINTIKNSKQSNVTYCLLKEF